MPTSPSSVSADRTHPSAGHTARPRSRAVPAGRRRTRHGDIAVDTITGLLVDLREAPDSARILPRGRAADRYTCLACGRALELCGPRGHAEFTARFRHTRLEPDRCPATGEHQARVRAAIADARALAETLLATTAGLRIRAAVTAVGTPQVPPVLALLLDSPSGASVVHLPGAELTDHQVDQILAAGGDADRQWVLFDRRYPGHYRAAGHVQVRIRRQAQRIGTITPTSGQTRLSQARLAIAWRDDGTLLLPFGGHPIIYAPRGGEDWSGTDASWQRDWKISQPRPADGAVWWGLLPLPLRVLAAPALLGAAVTAMSDLQAAQSGREAYRRRQARERYTQRQTRRAPAAPQQLVLSPAADAPVSTATASAPQPDVPAPAPTEPAPTPAPAAGRTARPPRWRRWHRILARLRRR